MDCYQVFVEDDKGVTLDIICKATESEADQEAKDIVAAAKKVGKFRKAIIFDVLSGLTPRSYSTME